MRRKSGLWTLHGPDARKPDVRIGPQNATRPDTGHTLEKTMHDIPLTPACVLFAVAFGLALGTLIALGI
jgi:hypothetical protein